jgi:hypothetical protein
VDSTALTTALTRIERLAALTLPRRDRDILMADLHEESSESPRGPTWRAWQTLRIAVRYHLECYHDPEDRLGIVALFAAAIALLWLVPLATGDYFPGGEAYFTDPFGRALIRFWAASHLTSAAAAGLIVGRTAIIPEHAALARWHVAVAAAATSLAWHGPSSGAVAAAVLLAAAWLGDRGRRALPDDTPVHG